MSAAVERPWKRQPETAPRPRGSPHAWQKKSEPATSSPAETETRARAPAGNGADESEAPPKPAVHEQIRARLLIDPDAIRAWTDSVGWSKGEARGARARTDTRLVQLLTVMTTLSLLVKGTKIG